MKRKNSDILCIVFSGLLLCANLCYAAPQIVEQVSANHTLELLISSSDPDNDQALQNQLSTYLVQLGKLKARSRSDKDFIRKVFFRTHRKFLRQYDPGAVLSETLTSGRYGCLSGTALYALILDHFGYNFEIIELPVHVYLKVHLQDQTLFIESTLPETGFIHTEAQKAVATKLYHDNFRINLSGMTISGLQGRSNSENGGFLSQKSIDLTQLSGLQHYNMAIYNLKGQAFREAFANAEKSIVLYPSKRTQTFMEIVINKILQSKTLSRDQKSGILNTYISQVRKKKLTQRKK